MLVNATSTSYLRDDAASLRLSKVRFKRTFSLTVIAIFAVLTCEYAFGGCGCPQQDGWYERIVQRSSRDYTKGPSKLLSATVIYEGGSLVLSRTIFSELPCSGPECRQLPTLPADQLPMSLVVTSVKPIVLNSGIDCDCDSPMLYRLALNDLHFDRIIADGLERPPKLHCC